MPVLNGDIPNPDHFNGDDGGDDSSDDFDSLLGGPTRRQDGFLTRS